AVVIGLFQPCQKRLQATILSRFGAENLQKTSKRRLRQTRQIGVWGAPSILDEAFLDRLADTFTLNVAKFRKDGDKNIAQCAGHVQIRHTRLPVDDLQRIEPQSVKIKQPY